MSQSEDSLQAQLEERIRFEALLADLSARFVGLPAEALDRGIEEAQRRICETLGLDRSTLGQPSKEGVPQFTHSWAAPGCMPVPHSPATPLVPWATQRIQSGHSIHFSSLDELPPEAAMDRETFRRVGTKSLRVLSSHGRRESHGRTLVWDRQEPNGSGPRTWSTVCG